MTTCCGELQSLKGNLSIFDPGPYFLMFLCFLYSSVSVQPMYGGCVIASVVQGSNPTSKPLLLVIPCFSSCFQSLFSCSMQ